MSIDYSELPAAYEDEVRAYVDRGILVGDTLRDAIARGDLAEAFYFARKTMDGPWALNALVRFFELEAPFECWGSKEKINAWIAVKAAQRIAKGEGG